MSSSLNAIRRVVEAFERSDWSEIDVRSGDVRVHLAVGDPSSSSTTPATAPPVHSASPGGPAPGGADGDPAAPPPDRPPATAAPVPPTVPPTVLPRGAHVVVSPSPGILWRSPQPGAPPFADLGDIVDASATVGIVEVMKLMTHVKAGIGGEIVVVCVANGVAVQQGEPLFAIAPSGSPS